MSTTYIYDNYSDVMSYILGGGDVSYSYLTAYYTTYAYIDSKNYASALTDEQMAYLFPLNT